MDEKKKVSLVPYKSYLAPKNATHKKIHILIPNKLGYEGKATIALTKESFWVVTPDGQYEQIPFQNIKDVKLDSFPGIVYKDLVDGIETYVAPNDTAGVTVEYAKVGRLTHRISFLTHLPNHAHDWIRLITEAVDMYYQRKRDDGIEKTDGDEEE